MIKKKDKITPQKVELIEPHQNTHKPKYTDEN